jgi:endonuclease G, mitochondrial
MFKSFRWFNNTLFLLFFFVVIGLTLHYRGRTKPLVAFWNDLKGLIFQRDTPTSQSPNPYKAPEPVEDIATDDKSQKSGGTLLEKEGIEVNSTESRVVSNKSKNNSQTSDDQTSDIEPQQTSQFGKDFNLPAIGSNDQIVKHLSYTLRYREQYEQADWVAYKLTSDEAESYMSREGNPFIPDPLVRTGSAVTTDYVRSGYDRGHLAPAGDFNLSADEKRESFYMSNMSPQIADFNRGIWSNLEQKFRDWARRDDELYVVTGPVLKPGLPTIGRYNEVAVPEQYYKIALCLTDDQPRMIGFLLNNEFSNENLKTFVVSVDEIERLTGIDFFARLPDNLEKKLEASTSTKGWFASRN